MGEFFKSLLSANVVISIVLAVLAIVLYIAIKVSKDRLLKKNRSSGTKATVITVSLSALRIVVILVALLAILQVNGVNVTAIVAGLGIVGAVVGLALQDYLRDIIMGLNILTEHFFTVGECVEYNGREGIIHSLSLKTTKISNLDDRSITTVCNRNFLEIRRLSNRLVIDIPLSYEEDLSRVREVMEKICRSIEECGNVEKCEFKGINSFESSSVNYRIWITCAPSERGEVRRASLGRVFELLETEGIRIPYSQLDVHCVNLHGEEK